MTTTTIHKALLARSVDELIQFARDSASEEADALSHVEPDDPSVALRLEVGIPLRSHTAVEELEQLNAWLPTATARRNAVFMDTTTILTASSLLSAGADTRLMTPLTLWDLATVVQHVVLSERIYHVGSRFIGDDSVLNAQLGEPVFHTIDMPPYDSKPGIIERHLGIISNDFGLAISAFEDKGSLGAVEAEQVTKAWSTILARDVTPEECFRIGQSRFFRDMWGSSEPLYTLKNLARSTYIGQYEGNHSRRSAEGPPLVRMGV